MIDELKFLLLTIVFLRQLGRRNIAWGNHYDIRWLGATTRLTEMRRMGRPHFQLA